MDRGYIGNPVYPVRLFPDVCANATFGLPKLCLLQDGQFPLYIWNEPGVKKIAREGDPKDFPKRGEGLFCHNNLYMAALFLPIIAMIPALILDFSFKVLAIWFAVIGLLLFRFFVIFQKTACVYCAAKKECPNAQAMGLDK